MPRAPAMCTPHSSARRACRPQKCNQRPLSIERLVAEAEDTSYGHACGAGASGAEKPHIGVVTDAEEGGPWCSAE